jgi:hypothetical protein
MTPLVVHLTSLPSRRMESWFILHLEEQNGIAVPSFMTNISPVPFVISLLQNEQNIQSTYLSFSFAFRTASKAQNMRSTYCPAKVTLT